MALKSVLAPPAASFGAAGTDAVRPTTTSNRVAMDLKMMDLAAAFDLDTDSDEDGKVRDSNGVMERAPTQNVAASLAGPSTGGVGGPVPEFVQRLLAEELKEWTLAQGESLSSGVQSDMQLDYAARLQTLAQLPCRADDAVRNDCNRLQEPSTEPEQWPPQQDVRSQAQTWAAATGEDDDALGEDDDDANLAAHALCNSLGRLPYSWPPERPKVAPKAEARRVEWTSAEDELIRNSVQRLGCKKWRAIAAQLPGRSDDAVRNRWSRLQQSKDDTWIYLCSKGCGQSFVHGPGRASHEKTCSHAAVRAQASEPGYAALTIQAGVYKAKVWRGGKYEHLGNFSTAEEAALCVARSQEGQPAAQRSECTRKPWTGREDDIIMQSVAELGHKWFAIGRRLPARHCGMLDGYSRLGCGQGYGRCSEPPLKATAPVLCTALSRLPTPNGAGRSMPSATDGRGCSQLTQTKPPLPTAAGQARWVLRDRMRCSCRSPCPSWPMTTRPSISRAATAATLRRALPSTAPRLQPSRAMPPSAPHRRQSFRPTSSLAWHPRLAPSKP